MVLHASILKNVVEHHCLVFRTANTVQQAEEKQMVEVKTSVLLALGLEGTTCESLVQLARWILKVVPSG